MSSLKKERDFVRFVLSTPSRSQARATLRLATPSQSDAVCEISHNILQETFDLKQIKQKLNRFRTSIRILGSKSINAQKRRRYVKKAAGQVYGILQILKPQLLKFLQ